MVVSDTCDTAKNEYISAKIAIANKTKAYQPCAGTDEAYPAVDETLQPVADPKTQNINTVSPIVQSINDSTTTYTALVTSTKALLAATQPLTDYKTILQNQLNATTQHNQSLQQKITTETNSMNQTMAAIPDLSNAGPFGASNVQQGVGYAFLTFYSFFFILLSVFLYIYFKNSISSSLLITGIVLVIGLAGLIAYICAVYGLGLVDPQYLVFTLNLQKESKRVDPPRRLP